MSTGCIVPFAERVLFATLPSPVPSAASLNSTRSRHPFNIRPSQPSHDSPSNPQTSSPPPSSADEDVDGAGPSKAAAARPMHWFSVDDDLVYQSFASDFGPLNLSMVYKFCIHLHGLLGNEKLAHSSVVLFTAEDDPQKKANAACLLALYVMIVMRKHPWEAFYPIANLEFVPFRDAGRGRGDFNLSIQDVLYGMYKALKLGLINLEEFDFEEYEHYERVENGDFNWVSKHFIAFASPQDKDYVRSLSKGGKTSSFPARKLSKSYRGLLDYFTEHNVQLVVRLNNPLYDKADFESRGIAHVDMFFEDGTNPTSEMIREFVGEAERVIANGGVVAVHCKAGLGRTGVLIAAWLVYHHSFTAGEAIGFMRICRPGMVVGPQQQFILTSHLEWAKWAGADEAVAAYKASLNAARSPSRQVTPPSDGISSALPHVTPARTALALVAATNSRAPVLQPRKTPLAKRLASALDEEDDEDDDPLGRPSPTKSRSRVNVETEIVRAIASPAKTRSRIAVPSRRLPQTESKVATTSKTLVSSRRPPASPTPTPALAASKLPVLKASVFKPNFSPMGSPQPRILNKNDVSIRMLAKEKRPVLRKRRSSLSHTDA